MNHYNSSLRIPKHEVVLVGLNHCHLEVIKKYSKKNIKPYRLTLVYSQNKYTFKENLPYALSKINTPGKELIDVGHLCHSSGVSLIHDTVKTLDCDRKELTLTKNNRKILFDAISIETISESLFKERNLKDFHGEVLEIGRPQEFLLKWQEIENELGSKNNHSLNKEYKIAVIGSTTVTAELAFSIKNKLNSTSPNRRVSVDLITNKLHGNKTRSNILEKELEKQAITVTKTDISEISSTPENPRCLKIADQLREYDLIIAAGTKTLPRWLIESELVNSEGLIKVLPTFELRDHKSYYFIPQDPKDEYTYHLIPRLRRSRRKAFTLTHNILTHFIGNKPTKYRRNPLRCSLINLGKSGSLLSILGVNLKTKILNPVKRNTDERWIKRYFTKQNKIRVSTFVESGVLSNSNCFGGSSMLPKEINSILPLGTNSHNIALIETDSDKKIVQAFDDLSSAQIDLSVFGQVAVNNVVNKIVATKNQPKTVQFSITVPYGPKQNMLYDYKKISEGIEYQASVNNLKIIGAQAKCGFDPMISIACQSAPTMSTHYQKRYEKEFTEGLDIILTKPLGTGVAIESFKHNILSTEHLYHMIDHMTKNQSDILKENIIDKVIEIVEISGYGLLGSLEEVMVLNSCGVDISLKDLPAYPGVLSSISSGIRANLHAQNKLKYTTHFMNLDQSSQIYGELLFDPQTAGPLILFSKPSDSKEIISSLNTAGLEFSKVIGKTTKVATQVKLN